MSYDGALKEFFERRQPSLLLDLTGGVPIVGSLNVELPKVQPRMVDLVLELADGSLLHVEFQSANSRNMAERMAEYHLLLYRRYKCRIRDVVLYVGWAPLRMTRTLATGSLSFAYELRDIRDWPAEEMLKSSRFGDQVLAILGGTADGRKLVRSVLERIAQLRQEQRSAALAYVAALSGLRRFETILKQEARSMGVVIDWKKNEILREVHDDVYREGLEQGIEQGIEQGVEEGRDEGLRIAIRAMFGSLPRWAEDQLKSATRKQLTAWVAKSRNAKRIEEVIKRR